MFCSKCGEEIADGSAYCSFCGAKQESIETSQTNSNSAVSSLKEPKKSKKKLWAVLLWLVTLSAIIGVVVWHQSTAWERDLTIQYIDFENVFDDNSCKVYEITNNTSHTLKDVAVVIRIENGVLPVKKWNIEDSILDLEPGETYTYRLYSSMIEKAVEERGEEMLAAQYDIVKINYKK